MRRILFSVALTIFLFGTMATAQTEADQYFSRASERAEAGDLDGAIADYTKVLELNPRDIDAYNNRGNARKNKAITKVRSTISRPR